MTFRDMESSFDLPPETDPREIVGKCSEELLLVQKRSFASCTSADYGLGL